MINILFLKLKISKNNFNNLLVFINVLFNLKLKFYMFCNIFQKKLKLENKKIITNEYCHIYNNLENSLKNFLTNKFKFQKILRFIEKQKYKNENYLNDISDGEEYKKPFEEINNKVKELHLNFILNMDGINPYNNSTKDYKAITLEIVEMGKKYRYRYDNHILLFLISGKNINFNLILKKFVEDLNKFYLFGFKYNGYLIRGRIICFTLDLPARAELFGQKKFNSKNSCIFCFQSGTSSKVGIRFPFLKNQKLRVNKNDLTIGFKKKPEENWWFNLITFHPKQIATDSLHFLFHGNFL